MPSAHSGSSYEAASTGEIEVKADDISGIAVHIAARVAARAQGGQVLVSSTVRDLVAGSGLTFADLGSARTKGLGRTTPAVLDCAAIGVMVWPSGSPVQTPIFLPGAPLAALAAATLPGTAERGCASF
jgi:hypothetical protein